jgi:hypothetical protein
MTNRVDYKPHAGSLAEKVCHFFQQHREEALSAPDIASKYDAKYASVTASLSTALEAGWLVRRNGDYAAGPRLPPLTSPALGTAMANLTTPLKRKNAPPNPAAIVIRTDVSIPAARTGIAGGVYSIILDRMSPGSMVELPDRQAHGLAACFKKRGVPYTVRRLGPGVKGVWRTDVAAVKPSKAVKAA